MPILIKPIPSLSDNYIWLIINTDNASSVIVDPGSSEPCIKYLQENEITPVAIIITHRHWDHVNGIEKLTKKYDLPVYGPDTEYIPCLTYPLKVNDTFTIAELSIDFKVIDISGHTAGHIGFLSENSLFCGDTLFSAGCGRLFDGTAEQLHASINRIAHLPPETVIYCTHEYTHDNLQFAQAVEPGNREIERKMAEVKDLRENNQPTLPFTLEQEKRYNPFLRTNKKSIMQAVAKHSGQKIVNSEDCFKYLRLWKDGF